MRWSEKIGSQVLRRLAAERRRIVGEWRILIECRRIAQTEAAPLPDESHARKVLDELISPNGLIPIEGVPGVYRVDVPYADVLPVSDEQIIQEANPLAVFSHLTALAHHVLTDQIPATVQATHYRPPDPRRIPLGTAPEEWSGLPLPLLRRPKRVGPVAIKWFLTKGTWDFGYMVNYSQGLPIYMTDVERTLLDAIRSPAEVGGAAIALRAWRQAKTVVDVGRLVEYTERFGQPVLRQRVGFLMETLGLTHPRLLEWKHHLLRGGSLKLVAAEAYAPEFSADWNLSLNVPRAVLAELWAE